MAAIICDFEDGASPTSDSATDVSEDSVEVKVQPVAMPATPARRNKRKSSEPRKIKDLAEPKQRHWEQVSDAESGCDFPPSSRCRLKLLKEDRRAQRHDRKPPPPAEPSAAREPVVFVHSRAAKSRTREVVKLSGDDSSSGSDDDGNGDGGEPERRQPSPAPSADSSCDPSNLSSAERTNFLLNLPFDVRNILGPSAESLLLSRQFPLPSDSLRGGGGGFDLDGGGANPSSPSSSAVGDGGDEAAQGSSFDSAGGSGESCKQKQRNYKNMTRERRIEANARERTRVHTISAAFENLRRAVPSYSCHQKLSKLAILRIACSYILALASLNESDYSSQQDCPSFAECVDLCTKTIQAEGKARKRKD